MNTHSINVSTNSEVHSTFAAIATIVVCCCDCGVLSAFSLWLEIAVSDWFSFIQDFRSHTIVRKISNIANSSKSHCEPLYAIHARSDPNFKQKFACDLRIANEMKMGLKSLSIFILLNGECL